MTITINSQKAFVVLLAILAILYAANIYTTSKLYAALVVEPIELSFILIPSPDGSCSECVDPQAVVDVIDKNHNVEYDTSITEFNSPVGEKYTEMYEIKNLPAIIVSGDIEENTILGSWESLGGRSVDDRIVIENLLPYYDLASDSVRGIVDAILLNDASCTDCFDVNLYQNIFKQFGVRAGEITVYDIASKEGSSLVQQYSIKKVPTILISPEVEVYQGIINTWDQVGTIEDDGWLILREVQKLSPEFKSL